ncbi:4-demethylwyosine synthase TYW1, partial [bacterium]
TVVRLTLARGLNMVEADAYADLIRRSSPDFVEVKAYMFVGWSRHRLSIGNMPSFAEIGRFADMIQAALGYPRAGESASSRVVLLARDPGSTMIRSE